MRNIPPALQTHLNGELLTPALCLRIDRADGTVLTLTGHDENIALDGETFITGATFNMSAIRSSGDFSVDNAEIELAIDGINVTLDDLASERLRNATFTLYLTNWQAPQDGFVVLKRGEIGEIEIVNKLFVKVQLRGLMGRLGNAFLETYSKTCRASFGDRRCSYASIPINMRVAGKRYAVSDWFISPAVVADATLTNPLFDAQGLVPYSGLETAITGWNIRGGQWGVVDATGGPYGVYGLEAAGGTDTGVSTIYKSVSTSSIGIVGTEIDAGDVSVQFALGYKSLIEGVRNTFSLTIIFYDNQGRLIKAATNSPDRPRDLLWNADHVSAFIPPQTRRIEFVIAVQRWIAGASGYVFGGAKVRYWATNSVAKIYKIARVIEGLTIATADAESAVPVHTDVRRGVLADVPPVYSEYTFDGQTIVQEYPANFGLGQVTGENGTRSFEAGDITQTAANMYGGKLVWLTGANAGKTSLVRSYNPTSKEVILYGALPVRPTVGDKYVWSRGCDKTIETCAALGNNINFRGEPYIPGPTKVIRYLTSAS